MEPIKIHVNVPQAVALAEGRSRCGRTHLEPSDEQLAELTLDERKWLVQSGALDTPARSVDLQTTRVEWAVVRDRVRALAADDAREKAKSKELCDREVAEFLAQSDEQLLGKAPTSLSSLSDWGSPNAPYSIRNDERVEARLRPLRREVERRNRIRKAEREEAEQKAQAVESAKVEERLAATKAAEESARESFRVFARELGGAAARCVEEGYDHVPHVVDFVVKQIVELNQGALVIREGSPEWDRVEWSERKAPNGHAFIVLDKVTTYVARVKRPTAMAIDVHRIMRVVVKLDDGDDDAKERYTGVVVYVTAPFTKDIAVIFRAEPIDA